ncbi:MAG TPA: hypothetical protein VD707_09740 [Gemmatimonadales bacterium]|jgi:hypothetical protein|nr:hypothetical protein [Gemmatimonadales bacterium]
MSGSLAWPVLLGLGALHGLNPGMGWLFAVALGLQEGKGRAVWRALPPLAAGHAAAIAAAVAVAGLAGMVVPPGALRWLVAALLLGLGVARLVRGRHPRWGGMRVGSREIAVWSFLMAAAHGAGLMVLPVLLEGQAPPTVHAHHAGGATAVAGAAPLGGLAATLVHTAGYLLVCGVVAAVVYRRFGLRWLRRGWVNLDAVWAAALVVTAVVTVVGG